MISAVAGKEAGFRRAQQEAQHQERGRPADQCEGTVDLRIDADRLVHLQRGEADIHAVGAAKQLSEQQERHQAPRHATHGFRLPGPCPGRRLGTFDFLWRQFL
jgi:hypothetical protein